MKKAIIVDLDGTLSNAEERLFYIEEHPKKWKEFHSESLNDEPHEWCVEIVRRFINDYEVFYITGRPEDYRSITYEWFEKWDIPKPDHLYMRKSNDFRKDDVVKKEIYEEKIKPGFEVLFAIDDRVHIADMWNKLGLNCLLIYNDEDKN